MTWRSARSSRRRRSSGEIRTSRGYRTSAPRGHEASEFTSRYARDSITDLRNRLSHYLRLVASGETITVLDRGIPVAQITPVVSAESELSRLASEGLVRLPLRPLHEDFLKRRLPRSRKPLSTALDEERADRS